MQLCKQTVRETLLLRKATVLKGGRKENLKNSMLSPLGEQNDDSQQYPSINCYLNAYIPISPSLELHPASDITMRTSMDFHFRR